MGFFNSRTSGLESYIPVPVPELQNVITAHPCSRLENVPRMFFFQSLDTSLESESGLFLTLCLGISGAQNENLRPNIQQIYPQLVGKIISETNFATLKWFSYARK